MIQKGSIILPVDKSGVWSVSTFHIYNGFFNKYATSGYFLKVSVKKIKNNTWLTKKAKIKSILILTKKEIKLNNFYVKFKINTCLLLKKRLTTFGSEVLGPSLKIIRRKKFIYSFSGTL
jgi:large subunit ribosomal protein L14